LNRKLVFLNLVLLAAVVAIGGQLRLRWREAKKHEREMIQRAPEVKPQLPPAPPAPVKPVAAVEYMDVAQRMLLSQDRNPNIILPPPPPPKPDPPVPPMPAYHGQMAWGDLSVVYLSTGNGEQKRYHVGEKVGPFEVVSFDLDNITFDWEGKKIEKKISDLKPKEAAQPQQVAAVAAPPPPAQAVTSLSSASATSLAADNKNPTFGTDMGGDFKACATGENSPAGTVLNGYKKVVVTSLMGRSCHWEPVSK